MSLLAAHVGAQTHDVAFICGNDDELELLEEAADFRERLPLIAPDLHRERNVVVLRESERDQHVRDRRPGPNRDDHVDRMQLREVITARGPARREVGITAPLEIADLVERHHTAIDLAADRLRDIVGPLTVVRRTQTLPPDEQKTVGECERGDSGSEAAAPERTDAGNTQGSPERRADDPQAAGRFVPERKRSPRRSQGDRQTEEQGR